MKVWAQKSDADRDTRNREDLNRNQMEAVIAGLIQDAKDSERSIVMEAYLKAVKSVEGLEPGQFTSAWVQVAIARQKRMRRFEPIPTNAIVRLPSVELDGYNAMGPALPTAIIRADDPGDVIEGERCFVEEETVQERSKEVQKYWLIAESGMAITQLRTEARKYLGFQLEVIGSMPKITVTLRKENNWEQAKNQMIFRILNPQDA